MSIFAIRDDDTSFFTSPTELEAVYSSHLGNVPISLGVVPFSVPSHRERVVFGTGSPTDKAMPLGDNTALVAWLQKQLEQSNIEVMLHGYSHEYRQIDGRWVSEFRWKSHHQLSEQVLSGRRYLEHILGTNIRVFVPPSNSISAAGVQAVRSAGLYISGLMGPWGDRPISWDYPAAYIKRWTWKIATGRPYPHVLRYGNSAELRAYALTPRSNPVLLERDLRLAASLQAPFVLATHYWELGSDASLVRTLCHLVQVAEELGMQFGRVSECFDAQPSPSCI